MLANKTVGAGNQYFLHTSRLQHYLFIAKLTLIRPGNLFEGVGYHIPKRRMIHAVRGFYYVKTIFPAQPRVFFVRSNDGVEFSFGNGQSEKRRGLVRTGYRFARFVNSNGLFRLSHITSVRSSVFIFSR